MLTRYKLWFYYSLLHGLLLQVLLEEANSKHSELTLHSSKVEQQLKLARSLLKEERAKRMLMMECPVLPDVGQLSSHQSAQQYVLANTVRILTLEEQNVDLRKQLMAPTAHRAKPQHSRQSYQTMARYQAAAMLQTTH